MSYYPTGQRPDEKVVIKVLLFVTLLALLTPILPTIGKIFIILSIAWWLTFVLSLLF